MFSGGSAAAWGALPWPRCWARRACWPAPSGRPERPRPRADLNGGLHHRARVRRVIQLFMNGGVSQMDTFDFKPELERRHGQTFDPGSHVEAPTSAPGNLMKSPFSVQAAWRLRAVGQQRVSRDRHLRRRPGVSDGALSSKTNVHGPASFMMNTGFLMPGFPCMGSWLSYGLGSLCDNLPTFVVLPDPKGLPYNAKGNFTSGFLPQSHQGVILDAGAPRPIPELFPPSSAGFLTPESERDGRAVLERLNRRHAAENEGDSRLESRIAAYELAARMQQQRARGSRPGRRDSGDACSLWPGRPGHGRLRPPVPAGAPAPGARRAVRAGLEWRRRGRRTTGTTTTTSPTSCRRWPGASTGRSRRLLRDLKARGLMEDTLVVFSTEFGRQPFTQGATGRDHNGGTSVAWLAGAGIKGGVRPRRERPLGLAGRHGPDLLLRPARHDPAPDGDRPHPAHVPPQRHRPPPDRRARARGRRDSGMSRSVIYLMFTPFLEIVTTALLPACPFSAPSI